MNREHTIISEINGNWKNNFVVIFRCFKRTIDRSRWQYDFKVEVTKVGSIIISKLFFKNLRNNIITDIEIEDIIHKPVEL